MTGFTLASASQSLLAPEPSVNRNLEFSFSELTGQQTPLEFHTMVTIAVPVTGTTTETIPLSVASSKPATIVMIATATDPVTQSSTEPLVQSQSTTALDTQIDIALELVQQTQAETRT